MANHRNVLSKSLLTHQQGKEISAYEFENPHLSRYEWLHTPGQPKEWWFELNRTLYPPDYQDDRQHTPRFLWGFSRPPKLCPCKFFWGERLPSLGHEEGHLWGFAWIPRTFSLQGNIRQTLRTTQVFAWWQQQWLIAIIHHQRHVPRNIDIIWILLK